MEDRKIFEPCFDGGFACVMQLMAGNPTEKAEIARRLRALQQALGEGREPVTHEEMAEHAGCGEKSWWAYQAGTQAMPYSCAGNLKQRFGITLDWIYLGDASRNPHDLQRKIDRALRSPVPLKRGPKST
jgi:hypothetical protein